LGDRDCKILSTAGTDLSPNGVLLTSPRTAQIHIRCLRRQDIFTGMTVAVRRAKSGIWRNDGRRWIGGRRRAATLGNNQNFYPKQSFLICVSFRDMVT
jgi:hypothetical protein